MEANFDWAALRSEMGPAVLGVFADISPAARIEARMDEIIARVEAVQKAAADEGRDLSKEEIAEIDALTAEFSDKEAAIKVLRNAGNLRDRAGEGTGRRTDATPVKAEPQPKDHKNGFHSFGEFAMSVKSASRKNATPDQRLIANAPTTTSTEGVGEDGGFLVPPEFSTEIVQKVGGETSLSALTDTMTVGRNSMSFPADETTPWQTSGGVQVYWEGEGDQFTQSKAKFETKTLRLNKLTALVPVTDELMEDAPAIESYLRRKVPEKMDYKIDDAILNGTGSGQPLGILNSGGLITVAKESGQTADTVEAENISNMYARMYAPLRRNAVWIANQDIEPQLDLLGFPTSSSQVPLYLPGGTLRDSPDPRLKGRPIIFHEAAKTLGDKGDLLFVDLSQYLMLQKAGGARVDTSIHLWFDYDTMAFRVIFRIGGMPWWNDTISRANGSNTLSAYVALAERA